MTDRYAKSERLLEQALDVIPLGSQTFSKSATHYPHGVSPYFITHGRGAHVWDVDGHRYVDFVNALCAVTLGYCDQDVDAAVRAQLEKGITFSLPHPIETEVAERIVAMVPCAEMVRFGKNGSDATAGAVRVARAYTGQDRVAVAGYHGWQDWYIGSTARHLGVPDATRALTHTFPYNDSAALEALLDRYEGEFAAVILEPMNITFPLPGYLEAVREITRRRGVILIFDETITGFRFANGGAQELFGVIPDLATLGKGLANGLPLSAVVGQRDLMKTMEEIFFSFTFGGETLSLAAAKATLQKLDCEPVLSDLAVRGQGVIDRTRALIEWHNAGAVLSVSGHPSWSFLQVQESNGYTPYEIRTLLQQELQVRGILTLGTHNMSYAHNDQDVDALIAAYDEIFPRLVAAVRERSIAQILQCEPLQPLFRVR